jgi:hypothetical protein
MIYTAIWVDTDDGTEFDSDYDDESLQSAAVRAFLEVPPGMRLVSVQEAAYAREMEDE